MEILYVKLTWFSAESSRLVILVLYFTLIWGATSVAPHCTSANIPMKSPPQCLSLSPLIVERQVGVPEWQLNYSQCVQCMYGCVLIFWVFQSCPLGRNVVKTSHSRFWKWNCLLNLVFLNHQIHSVSNPADIKAEMSASQAIAQNKHQATRFQVP